MNNLSHTVVIEETKKKQKKQQHEKDVKKSFNTIYFWLFEVIKPMNLFFSFLVRNIQNRNESIN